jgi:ABC-type multidrug transport system ATPase subunit
LIIVDEPTAGLDPEERLRFYHLLAELAEGRIVLLSTHIVEDVSVLCRRFALIRGGRLVALTTPAEARASLEGTVIEGSVEKGDLERLRASHHVIQSMLVEGRLRVRIHASSGEVVPGFTSVRPTLEDAYLVLTSADGRARAAGERALVGTGTAP